MLLKNTSRRLITINVPGKDGKNVATKILPGENPAVEIPDELGKTKFVKALIKDGSLSIQLPVEDDDEESNGTDLESKSKDELKTLAEMMTIEVTSKMTKQDLIDAIQGESE